MGLARTTFSPKRRECEDGGRQRERGYSLGYFLEDGNFGSEWGSGALKRRLTSAGSEEERGSGGEEPQKTEEEITRSHFRDWLTEWKLRLVEWFYKMDKYSFT